MFDWRVLFSTQFVGCECRYNTVMKIIYILTSIWIVHYMRFDRVVKQTYDREQDTFRYVFLIAPCLFLAMVIHYSSSLTEILWTFSIYLESVAILPQLVLMQRTQNIDNLTLSLIHI